MIVPVTYSFGRYRLDTVGKTLSRDGELIPLTRKRYEILLMLIERAGQVIRKEEMMDHIWPGQAVEEGNLTQHVFYLRRTLGDEPNSPNYILTVPGVGYLFYQSVQAVDANGNTETIGGFQGGGESARLPEGLELATADLTPTSTFPSGSWFLGSLFTLASLLLVIFIALLVWWRRDGDRPSRPPPVEPIVTIPGTKGDLRFSSDGRYLAFTNEADTVDSLNIFVKSLDGPEIVRLTNNPHADHSLAWSPDNSRIAFLREGSLSDFKNQILIVPAAGGEERIIGKAWHGLDWSPDGQSLAICDSDGRGQPTGIHLLSLSTLRSVPVSKPNPGENLFDSDPKFSPDGRFIAFTRWTSSSTGDIFTIELQTGRLRQLTFDRCRMGSIQWVSEGRELLFVSNRTGHNRAWRIPAEGGEALAIEGLLGEVDKIAAVSKNQSDRLLAYTQRFDDTNITVNKLPGQGATASPPAPCSINSTRADHSPQFSPDGAKVAFISARSGFEEVWIASVDCASVTQLTSFKENGVGSPRWSPDGRKIAFDRHVREQSDIFLIDVETRELQRLTDHPSPDLLPAWSHDGKEVFFCSERAKGSEIWKVSTTSGEQTQVTRFGGRESWASSDGQQLYYTSYNAIWLKSLFTGDEGLIKELKGVFFGRYWTLRGRGIYYLTRETRNRCQIHRFDLTTRETKQIMEFSNTPTRYVPGFSISPDESRIAISLMSYNPGDISLIRGWN